MDWFSWLSKAGLEPSLVYEYGLTFAHNELEEDDLAYFNHDFLQSMGISIAKHRLEILKLARKTKGATAGIMKSNNNPNPISITRLVSAIKNTKRCLGKYIRMLGRHDQDSALVVAPSRPPSSTTYSSRWRLSGAMLLKRNNNKKKSTPAKMKQGRSTPSLMLTNGMSPSLGTPQYPLSIGASPSTTFYDPANYELVDDDDEDEDSYWASAVGVQEIKWDTMFQDLKPT